MPPIGPDRYGQEAVGRAPAGRLLWVAVSLIGGIILGRLEFVGGIVLAGVLVVCLAGVGLVMILPVWQGPRKARWIFTGLCLGFACLGGLRYELVYSYYPRDHLVHYVRKEQQLTTLRGKIITDPYVAKPTGSLAKFDFIHQPITIFTMSCSGVRLAGGWQTVSGRVLVIVDEPAGNLRAGQEVQFDSWIMLRGGPANPGQYDRRDSQHGSRTLVSARVNSSESIAILTDAQQGVFPRFRRKLADLAYAAVIEDAWFDMPAVAASYLPVTDSLVDKDSQGFLEALLLGHRHHIAGELTETFLRCGALHFLSVSGLHVGLLAGFVWWIGQVLRLRRWWRGLLALTVVVLFLFIVPPRAPILRAGIGCCIFFIAIMARRETGAINLLSLSAIVILLMRPLELFNAGFQLSFVVVLGLVLFAPRMYKRELLAPEYPLVEIKPVKLEKPPVWWKFAGGVGLRFVWGLVVVAVVAWVVGLPLTAYHFNRIAPWGMFASVILFCPIMLTLLIGFSRLFLAAVFPALSTLLAWPLYALSQMSIKLAQWISALPYSSVNTGSPPIWFIALFYGVLIWAGRTLYVGRKLPGWVVGAVLVWFIGFVWMLPGSRDGATRDGLSFRVLSVGHGLAVVGQLSDGKVIMYDAGSMSNFNVGSTVILPFLRSAGINRIDGLFISHANIDHYSAVLDLCRNFDVGKVYVSEYFVHRAHDAGPASAVGTLLAGLEEIGQPIETLHRGDRLFGREGYSGDGSGWEIEVLWPVRFSPSSELSANDSSLVVRVVDRGGSILLTGDIHEIGQQLLLELDGAEGLEADAMLVPHHGSVTNTLQEFVEAVDPRWLLNSSGRLTDRQLERLGETLPGREVSHTFQTGALMLRITDEGGRLRTFLSE